MNAQVSFGAKEQIDEWMELVRAVRGNFPGLETAEGLEEHKRTVLRFMEKRQALCVLLEERIAGVLLFSRRQNRVCCLAVHPEKRRLGLGALLLSRALEELDRGREITVSTFREGDPLAAAPRALYRKFGFTSGALTEEFGYPNQEMILRPRDRS